MLQLKKKKKKSFFINRKGQGLTLECSVRADACKAEGPDDWQTDVAWETGRSPGRGPPEPELPQPLQGVRDPPQNGNKSALGTGEHVISTGRDTQDHRGFGGTAGPVHTGNSSDILGTF